MYVKNLTEDLRLRLSKTDMDFLRGMSATRNSSVSECIRSIIGEYRRSIEVMATLRDAMELVKNNKEGGGLSNGDTKTDFNNKL